MKKIFILCILGLFQINCNNTNNPVDSYLDYRWVLTDGTLHLDSLNDSNNSPLTNIKSVSATLFNDTLTIEIEPENLYDTIQHDSLEFIFYDLSATIDCNKNRITDAGDLIVSTMFTMFPENNHSFYYRTVMFDSSETSSIFVYKNNTLAVNSARVKSRVSAGKITVKVPNSYSIDKETPIKYDISLSTNNNKMLYYDGYP